MKRLSVYFVLFFVGLAAQAQGFDSLEINTVETKKFEYVMVEGGLAIPIGNLRNVMSIAPNLGFWIRQPKSESTILNYGVSLSFPKRGYFNYENDTYRTHTKSFNGFVGIRLDKMKTLNQRHDIRIGWSSTMGVGFYFYDDIRARQEYEEWPDWKKDNDKNQKPVFVKSLTTLSVGQGINIHIGNFGIYTRYNFSPYNAFTSKVDQKFGSQSISLGLLYTQ